MLFSLFSISIGFLISFSPSTAIVGVIVAFVLSFAYSKSIKNHFRTKDAINSIIGLAFGTVAGLIIYGTDSYIRQWHSFWWIPMLWFVGSLAGMLISIYQSKGDLENGS